MGNKIVKILTKTLCILATVGATVTIAHAAPQERYAVIGGATTDPFWTVIRRGAEEAGKDLNVEVDYLPQDADYVASTVRIVQTVVAQKFDGLATPIPDADALKDPMARLHAAGIDLVVMNSGGSSANDMDALTFVGQTESVAGEVAGEAAKKLDQPKKVICVNHYIMDADSTRRCKGFAAGSGAKMVEIDSTEDPSSVAQRVQAALSANPDADAVLTLGPVGAIPTIELFKKLGLNGKIHFYTFDLNPEILEGLEDGTIAFAIDQQPFLQGYLAVATLHAHHKFGVAPIGSINTGPAIVTKADVDKFKQGVAAGIR
jgi:simple sugar transport system substrate-binding protein